MALKIAVWYALIGALWILCTDWWVHHFAHGGALEEALETIKGWFFVSVTALLLGLTMDRYFRVIRRSAQLLQDNEHRLQFVLTGTGQAIWDWDVQAKKVFYDDQWKATLGFEPHEIGNSQDEWEARIHPEDLPQVWAEIQRLLDGHTTEYVGEHRVYCKDGSIKWILDRGKVLIRTPDGKPTRVLGTHLDITQRKQQERLQSISVEVLGILNNPQAFPDVAQRILVAIKRETGIDAVSIRLRKSGDFQHCGADSISKSLLQTENSLDWRTPDGECCLDENGKVRLECACGMVLSGQTDPNNPLCTPGGSVWTNDAPRFLHIPSAQDPRRNPRNCCIQENFQSVAIIPVRAKQEIIGLLQINDPRKNCFNLEMIRFFEGIAASFGVALQRERDEQELRESQSNLRSLFDAISESVFLMDTEGIVLAANATFAERLGKRPEECVGASVYSLVPSDTSARRREWVDDVIRTQKPVVYEDERDGRFLRHSICLVQGIDNHVKRVVVFAIDITELRRAEEALRESELRRSLAMEAANLGIWDWDMLSNKITWSEAHEALWGYPPGGFPGTAEGFTSRVHPDDLPELWQVGERAIREKKPFQYEYRVIWPDSSVHWIASYGRYLFDANGRPIRIIGVVLDITERKQADVVLQESLLFRREAEKIARVGAWKANPKTDYLYWTEGVYEILEAPLDYKPGFEDGLKFYASESIPLLRESLTRALTDGTPFAVEAALTTMTGKHLWAEVRGLAGMQEGEQAFVMGTFQDITARKKAEEALEQRELEFRVMFEVASIGMAQADITTGQWLRVNKQMCAITGYSPEEMLRMHIPDLTHPEDRQRDWEMFQKVIRGEMPHYRIEKRYVRKNGEVAWVSVNMTVVRDAAGHPLRTMATIEDITERKRLESHLRQAQKLEAIGQLAGGVAHDFNNILAVMMTHLGLLLMDSNLDSETQQALRDIDAEARRAAELTRQLLMFGRRSVLLVKPLDLNDIVVNLLKMLKRLIGEHIDLRFDEKSALPTVEADASMMEQVLMNLVVNARDAMPKGGRITISTAQTDLETAQAAANPVRRRGRFVCLAVSDTGSGIDAATLKRIFEPFFTTKEVGKGTGLGLATVHGIVAQHKGWVEVDSKVGQGTTFRVYLPAIDRSPVTVAQPPKAKPVGGGQETILLVEDELSLRHLVAHTLRVLGYKVYEAVNGVEAMILWQIHGSQVDLLFTDMVMPEGMTGLELVEQLRSLKPGLKAIISSGYSMEMAQTRAPNKEGFVYLPKPFNTEALAKAVRDCLDNNSRTSKSTP